MTNIQTYLDCYEDGEEMFIEPYDSLFEILVNWNESINKGA